MSWSWLWWSVAALLLGVCNSIAVLCLVYELEASGDTLKAAAAVISLVGLFAVGAGQLFRGSAHGAVTVVGKRLDGVGKIVSLFGWSVGVFGVVGVMTAVFPDSEVAAGLLVNVMFAVIALLLVGLVVFTFIINRRGKKSQRSDDFEQFETVDVRVAAWRDFGSLLVVQLHGFWLAKRLRVPVTLVVLLLLVAIWNITRQATGGALAALSASFLAAEAAAVAFAVLVVVVAAIVTGVSLTLRSVRVFVLDRQGRVESSLTVRRARGRKIIAQDHVRRVSSEPKHSAVLLRREVAARLRPESDRDGLTLMLTAASAKLASAYVQDIDGLEKVASWRCWFGVHPMIRRPVSADSQADAPQ